MASMAGMSSCPKSVRAYSTDGGEVGFTCRETTPLFSSWRNRVVSTLADIGGISICNSLKRRGPPLKYHRTLGVHAPFRIVMHSDSGHALGVSGLLFFLTGKTMMGAFNNFSYKRLPTGNLIIKLLLVIWFTIVTIVSISIFIPAGTSWETQRDNPFLSG